MRNRPFRFAGLCLLLAAWLLVTCDPFQEDVIPKEKLVTANKSATEYYILPNSSTIIDLKAIVSSAFTNISIKVSENPKRGTLTSLDDFILKYTPYASFTDDVNFIGAGKDQFKVAFTSNEKILSTETISVHMTRYANGFPCSIYAVEDVAHTMPATPVSIKILFNDRLCGIKVSDVQASVSLHPKHGHAMIESDSIIYTPETGFEGLDEIVYKISATMNQQTSGGNGLLVSYGLIRVRSEACPFFIFDSVALDLTDEVQDVLNAGQCDGGYDIPVWEIDIPPCVHYGYYSKVISQSNHSGSICSGTDGSFAYYPDPDKTPKNDTAKVEVCINGQCRQVMISIIREESG